jgi:hypothetical protein
VPFGHLFISVITTTSGIFDLPMPYVGCPIQAGPQRPKEMPKTHPRRAAASASSQEAHRANEKENQREQHMELIWRHRQHWLRYPGRDQRRTKTKVTCHTGHAICPPKKNATRNCPIAYCCCPPSSQPRGPGPRPSGRALDRPAPAQGRTSCLSMHDTRHRLRAYNE